MKTNIIKGALASIVLVGASLMTGCSCSPVAEETCSDTYAVRPITQTRTIRTLAPVAESCDFPVENTATLCD